MKQGCSISNIRFAEKARNIIANFVFLNTLNIGLFPCYNIRNIRVCIISIYIGKVYTFIHCKYTKYTKADYILFLVFDRNGLVFEKFL